MSATTNMKNGGRNSNSCSNKRGGDGKGDTTIVGGNPPSNRKLSHSLSWALRHSALDIGLTMQEDGYVPVQEILDSRHPRLRGATMEQIQDVVATSDKQRFKLEERPMWLYHPKVDDDSNGATNDGSKGRGKCPLDDADSESTILCIRANQGHSIKTIRPDLLLTKLAPSELTSLPCIIHGTYTDAWKSIEKEGLSKGTRTHIHFVPGLLKDDGVISGMRQSCSVHIYLDVARCAAAAADGIVEFYISANGVILTDGIDNKGTLPPEYFSHVTESSTANILLDNRSADPQGHVKIAPMD